MGMIVDRQCNKLVKSGQGYWSFQKSAALDLVINEGHWRVGHIKVESLTRVAF
jgi:hypothetical protein